MPYGQINYPQQLGTGPTIDSIADVGCFLTAFCNLLERFGEVIDPPTLNNFFISHNSYLADGANRDNLGWGSVSAYDGNVVSTGQGASGWPPSNDAIVKFIYKSARTGANVTHFCLVVDHTNGTILDSWDGKVKATPYGQPVAWSTYERHTAQVVTPPPPAEAPAFTVEAIPGRTEQLKVNTHLWDLSQRSWPGLVNNPVSDAAVGLEFHTSQVAHHIMGGSYYLPDGSASQGYNTVDCENPPAAPTPPPAPTNYDKNVVDGITFETVPNAPKAMYIAKVGGAEKWSFKNVSTWRQFTSVQHVDYGTQVFIVGVAHHPIPPKGADYYMVDADFGDFKKTGNVVNQYGFNWADLSETKPPALEAPAPPPAAVTTPEPPAETAPAAHVEAAADSTAPVDWKDTFKPFPAPVHYVATRDLIVVDLSGQQPNMPLARYNPGVSDVTGTVSAFGTITKDGVEYYRLKTNNDPTFSFYYCVPKIDANTHTPNLLVKPVPGAPVSKATVARDTVHLAKNRFETDIPKFLDDIIPRWLHKNKK